MANLGLEWEVTDEDIAQALQENCSPNGENDILEVREFLDFERVANAALYGDTIEEQFNYAQANILEQIRAQ